MLICPAWRTVFRVFASCEASKSVNSQPNVFEICRDREITNTTFPSLSLFAALQFCNSKISAVRTGKKPVEGFDVVHFESTQWTHLVGVSLYKRLPDLWPRPLGGGCLLRWGRGPGWSLQTRSLHTAEIWWRSPAQGPRWHCTLHGVKTLWGKHWTSLTFRHHRSDRSINR